MTRVIAALRHIPAEQRLGIVHDDRHRRVEVFTKRGAVFVSTMFKGPGGQHVRFIASTRGAQVLHALLGKVLKGKGKEYVVPAASVWTLAEVRDLADWPKLPQKRKS